MDISDDLPYLQENKNRIGKNVRQNYLNTLELNEILKNKRTVVKNNERSIRDFITKYHEKNYMYDTDELLRFMVKYGHILKTDYELAKNKKIVQ